MTSSASIIETPELLDAVPAHEARRRPVGRDRFHQPASGIFGGKRDALGLPARSPAYPAKTASSRRRAGPAAGNDGRGDGKRSGSRRGWSGPAPRRGRPWRGTRGGPTRRIPGVTQSAGGPPRARSTRKALLSSSWVGRPLEGSGAGRASAARSGGSFDVTSRAIGRASLPSCSRMGDVEPGVAVASIKTSTRPPGASTSAPPRAGNGSAGWPSRAMTCTSWPSILTAMTSRWKPLMMRSLSRSLVGSEGRGYSGR